MKKPTILLAESDEALRSGLRSVLVACGFGVVEAASADAVLQEVQANGRFCLLIADSRLRTANDGLEAAKEAISLHRGLPVIVIASESSEALAVAALRAGFADYFKKPLAVEDLLASVHRCLSGRCPIENPRNRGTDDSVKTEMIGQSQPMREARDYLLKVASTESNALITGETGTGKELAAEMIHRRSPRGRKPFVRINCAAIPDGLLESELFGYERGAFTGAQAPREGTLKLADGGTVFFDEIGDMSSYAQAKILRAIEAKEVRRLGGRQEVSLDIRVIAATNRDLEQLVAEQKFRADLFFRLNVANIHLPPLRTRKEDLLPLCDHYIRQMNGRSGLNVEGFTSETFDALLHHDWPGNVRELKNLIEAVFISPPVRWISFAHLPDHFRKQCKQAASTFDNERDRLLSALLATNWNKSRAARQLHWSRMTLYRKITRYQVVEKPAARTSEDDP